MISCHFFLGNPTVDYFSLDIEGAELQVLKTIPFDKVDIKILDVEVDHIGQVFGGSKAEFRSLLRDNGYVFYARAATNDVYVKKELLKDLNEMPKRVE